MIKRVYRISKDGKKTLMKFKIKDQEVTELPGVLVEDHLKGKTGTFEVIDVIIKRK